MGRGAPMGAMASNSESKLTLKALIHQQQTWQIPLHYQMTTMSPIETLYKGSLPSKFNN